MPAPNIQSPRRCRTAERQRTDRSDHLFELEMKARELLPQTAYDYYASGANDEITLRENRVAYERIMLLPRSWLM
jgi:hypothetical protein